MFFRRRRHPVRALATSLLAAGCFVVAAVYYFDLSLRAIGAIVLWTSVCLAGIVLLSVVAVAIGKLVAGAVRRLGKREEAE